MNALGYIRISPRGSGYDGVSLEVQSKAIKDYCAFKDINLLAIYGDKFISGKELKNRPGINAVLSLASEKKVDAVIVYKLDRFMRNTIETLDTCAALEEWGVKFMSLHEEINTDTATGRFFLTMLAALGQMEREQISERTKAALHLKRLKGEWLGGQAPIGFRKQGKRIVPDDSDYNMYLRLKELKAAKVPYQTWEDILYAEGHRTRKGGKRTYSSIWRIEKKFDAQTPEELWAAYSYAGYSIESIAEEKEA